jgi:hypothetical protein
LAAALAAAAVMAVSVVVLLSLLLASALLLLDEDFVGVAGPADRTWLGSAGSGTPFVAGFPGEPSLPGTPAAAPLAVEVLGVGEPLFPPVDALAGVFPAAGRFSATCGSADAELSLTGVAAGSELGLAPDDWEEPRLRAGAPPAFFGAGFVEAVFVGAGFVGAEFAGVEPVGA